MPLFETFTGRTREIKQLDRLWNQSQATMLVLYGRRRVGKTRLITHWIKDRQKRALYWVAEPSSATDQLRSFSQAIYNFEKRGEPAPDDFTFANWQQAFQQVAGLAERDRFALFIDEFTYVLAIDPSIAGLLQNLWDHMLKESNLFLTLCGSHMGMMQRQFLSYQAPLYGRATQQMHLQPLTFGTTASFFPNYRPDERVALYAIFGGVPAYWERIEPERSISQNIRRQLLTPNNLMQSEPRLILQDFIQEPHNYVSILRAISNGDRTQKQISIRTGLAQGHISKYLGVLREAGFIERRIPVTASISSRMGRYHITDPYLRFYYRFLSSRQAQLALGETDLALMEIRQHLIDFIGTHPWEEICREWTLRAGVRGKLGLTPDQVGSVWTKNAQVDVVGINSMEKTIILGECKWSTKSISQNVLQELVDKTGEIVPRKGRWQVKYIGFARQGWTNAAHEFAAKVHEMIQPEGNWSVAGMELFDLQTIDQDLQMWT
ncbi:MAG: ATP-binding protein [Chloroflexota bacterium]